MSHMSGRASFWATAEWGRQSPVCASYAAFAKAMKNIFQRERPGREAARSLLRLQQGQRSVTDFAIKFRRLAADSGWPTSALVDVFSLGLADQVRKQMIPLKTPDNLDELVALAVEIENRLVDWEKERLRTSTYNGSGHGARQTAFAPIPSVDTPPISYKEKTMQLGGNRLAPAERDRRLRLQLCLYCGKAEHRITHCPLRPARRRIQASPPRRIQASPPRCIQASPPHRLQASPPRRIQASPPRRIQASPPRRIQASPPPATDPAPLLPSTGRESYDHIIIPTILVLGIILIFAGVCMLMVKQYKRRIAELQNQDNVWSRLSRLSRRIRSTHLQPVSANPRRPREESEVALNNLPSSSRCKVGPKSCKPFMPAPESQPKDNIYSEDLSDADDYENTAGLSVHRNC
ncbi:uncharacterized protein [Nerophis lumbriciformis]|uniref:uncharacterized protein isoform X2 n=1 Tax=Nerophis lumbriciformis TaxID=546530 RepID=UPI003BAA1B2B